MLEAGCGRDQYVFALFRLGYEPVGADFSHELIVAIISFGGRPQDRLTAISGKEAFDWG